VWTCLTCGFAETEKHLPHTRTKMCVGERRLLSDQDSLVERPTWNYLKETTRPLRPLMERAVCFLRCLGALRVVVALEVLF
jgi:hypothetical protein